MADEISPEQISGKAELIDVLQNFFGSFLAAPSLAALAEYLIEQGYEKRS